MKKKLGPESNVFTVVPASLFLFMTLARFFSRTDGGIYSRTDGGYTGRVCVCVAGGRVPCLFAHYVAISTPRLCETIGSSA